MLGLSFIFRSIIGPLLSVKSYFLQEAIIDTKLNEFRTGISLY